MAKTYHFKLVLADVVEVSDDEGDALFDAGCDDGTIVSRDGVTEIPWVRQTVGADGSQHARL